MDENRVGTVGCVVLQISFHTDKWPCLFSLLMKSCVSVFIDGAHLLVWSWLFLEGLRCSPVKKLKLWCLLFEWGLSGRWCVNAVENLVFETLKEARLCL